MGFIIFVIVIAVIVIRSRKIAEESRDSRRYPSDLPVNHPVRTQPVQKAAKLSIESAAKVTPVDDTDEVRVESSTMDYLAEKAENESRSESSSRSVVSGKAGRRLPDWGDPAANEMVVTCEYCGADNVLPRGGRRRDYTCYFCREKL